MHYVRATSSEANQTDATVFGVRSSCDPVWQTTVLIQIRESFGCAFSLLVFNLRYWSRLRLDSWVPDPTARGRKGSLYSLFQLGLKVQTLQSQSVTPIWTKRSSFSLDWYLYPDQSQLGLPIGIKSSFACYFKRKASHVESHELCRWDGKEPIHEQEVLSSNFADQN